MVKVKNPDDPVLISNRKKYGRLGPRRPLHTEESDASSPRCKKPRSSGLPANEVGNYYFRGLSVGNR